MSKLYEAQQALDRAEDTLNESAHNLTGGFTIVNFMNYLSVQASFRTRQLIGFKQHFSSASQVITI